MHGTNYVVPPATAIRLVSVYDLSFVHDAESAASNVRRFDRAVRTAIGRGAHVHTTSHAVAAEIEDRYGVTAHVVAPGVHIPNAAGAASAGASAGAQAKAVAGPSTIAAIGTVTRRKNFPLLVRAFANIARSNPDVRLVLAGADGDDSEALRSEIAGLPALIGDRVSLVGWVSDAEALYRQATVIAHPSRYEGVGLPVLEAMAHGVPVVAARAAAVVETAGGAAELVDVDDEESLAAALVAVLGDDVLQQSLIDRGHDRAQECSWASSADAMLSVYRTLGG